MNERERVYDLISEYAIQYREWMNKGVKLPRLDREEVVDQIDALYDALYSDREKAMREVLEWACDEMRDANGCEKCSKIIIGCPIKQALEEK